MESRYKTYGHAKMRLRYHLIFSTKFRRKCLNQIHDSVIDAFRQTEARSNFSILTIELDKDHIHLLIESKPKYSIEQVVSRLKQMTTQYLWKKHGNFLSKYYWKQRNILWTRGYFCATVGYASEETIRRYIENQG